jgi:hypothetical protein
MSAASQNSPLQRSPYCFVPGLGRKAEVSGENRPIFVAVELSPTFPAPRSVSVLVIYYTGRLMILRSRTFMHFLSGNIRFAVADEPSSALDPKGEHQLF